MTTTNRPMTPDEISLDATAVLWDIGHRLSGAEGNGAGRPSIDQLRMMGREMHHQIKRLRMPSEDPQADQPRLNPQIDSIMDALTSAEVSRRRFAQPHDLDNGNA
jgi:hypothetical protein